MFYTLNTLYNTKKNKNKNKSKKNKNKNEKNAIHRRVGRGGGEVGDTLDFSHCCCWNINYFYFHKHTNTFPSDKIGVSTKIN